MEYNLQKKPLWILKLTQYHKSTEKKIKVKHIQKNSRLSQGHPELGIIECVCALSHVWLSVTPWTIACQAPLSLGFSRQDYWNELPFSYPVNLLDLGIKPTSPALAGRNTGPPGNHWVFIIKLHQRPGNFHKRALYLRKLFLEHWEKTQICGLIFPPVL